MAKGAGKRENKVSTETSSASGILYKLKDKDTWYQCYEKNCTAKTSDKQEFRNHLRKDHNVADEAVLDKKTEEYRVTLILDLSQLSEEDAEKVLKRLVPDTAKNEPQASASGTIKSKGIQVWYQCCIKGCQPLSYIFKDEFQNHLTTNHLITNENYLNAFTEKSIKILEL